MALPMSAAGILVATPYGKLNTLMGQSLLNNVILTPEQQGTAYLISRGEAQMKAATAWRLIPAILLVFLFLDRTAAAQDAAWPRSIVLGTASPGGPYYAYGQGLARILARTLSIEVTAQVTQGPAQNLVLMEKKEAMLGFITVGVALQGWNGTDWAKGTQYRSMRVMFPMYDTAFQFAALKRVGIKSLDQFMGLRIGVGPRAGTGGTYVPEIFKLLGIASDIRFGAIEQVADQAEAGALDGVAIGTGFPIPAITDLESKLPVDFIQPTSEQIAVVRQGLPEITPSAVPAGTYRSLTRDYHTIGLYNFAIAHESLPDDLVYRIVKAVFENRDELVKAHTAAKETIPANMERNMLPMHPGALRYYREIGVSPPSNMLLGK